MSTLHLEIPHFVDLYRHGRERLHAGARRALERRGDEISVASAAIPDAAFDDPRLHAYFHMHDAEMPLMQIVVGYLPPECRPTVTVVADEHGIVHVPRVGQWSGLAANERASLEWRDGWVLQKEPAIADFSPTRRIGVAGITEIEVVGCADPLLRRVLLQGGNRTEDPRISECARRHTGTLERALARMSLLDADYAAEIARDGRVLYLFKSAQLLSCANISAYGAAFLQCEDDASEVFFCEDLAHQVGHVTFYNVTADPRRCFRIPPQTPVSLVSGDANDSRSLFDALHGNFTVARMVQVFDALMDASWSPLEYEELRGRFAQALQRLEQGLLSIDDERLFTPEVWAMHRWFWKLHVATVRRRGPALEGSDLGDQPYVFSWEVYRRRNGLGTAAD